MLDIALVTEVYQLVKRVGISISMQETKNFTPLVARAKVNELELVAVHQPLSIKVANRSVLQTVNVVDNHSYSGTFDGMGTANKHAGEIALSNIAFTGMVDFMKVDLLTTCPFIEKVLEHVDSYY